MMKKILVSIKRVPDYEAKIKILPDASGFEKANLKWIINPFDEIAVEEAVKIKEKYPDTEITVLSIGTKETTEILRKAMAMGADKAILVLTEEYVDSDLASRVLVALSQKDNFDLIIAGKQSIDSDANQTMQLFASRLNLPQATCASKVEIAADWTTATVVREVDGGLETIKVELPCVITTDLRLNTPRLTSLPAIIKAKSKPLEEIALSSVVSDQETKVKIKKLSYSQKRTSGQIVSTVEELFQKLSSDKVI